MKYKCLNCGQFECNVPDNFVLDKCPVCNKSFHSDLNWMQKLYSDDSYWYIDGFKHFPSIIAHEYWRLREMFGSEQSYGLFFEIRDVMESLLKFEILVICAWAESEKMVDFQKQVGCQITNRNLSLGSWYEIAQKIINYFSDNNAHSLPSLFFVVLYGLISEYGDNAQYLKIHNAEYKNRFGTYMQGMINWRNEKVGHGALGFEEDEEFRSDLIAMVERFKYLFEMKATNATMTVGEALIAQKTWIENTEASGYGFIDPISDNKMMRIFNPIAKLSFPLYPYIVCSEGRIYLFDNQKSERRTRQQCYYDGQHREAIIPFFSNLSKMNRNVNHEIDISTRNRILEEDNLINRIGIAKLYTEPTYLMSWLSQSIKAHKRGVFLLKMSRGAGKSTFTERLNCLYRKPQIVEDDMDVRTYHVTRSQMINAKDFVWHIEEQWKHDYEGRSEWTGYTHIVENETRMTRSQAFAVYLRECLYFTKSRRGKKRIMLVIDGLDEILDEEIWNYIPEPTQLPEGVYILLTSRDPLSEQLPHDVETKLKNLTVSEEKTVGLQNHDSCLFLYNFIKNHLQKKSINEGEFEILCQLADYRVLYLDVLCKVIEHGMPLQSIPKTQDIIQWYLRMIEMNNSSKEVIRIKELLSVFCSIGIKEPLSLREIAGLLYDERVSLQLIAHINDLSPLLRIRRGFRANGRLYKGDNRYELANEKVVEAVRNVIPEWEIISKGLLETAYQDAITNSIQGKRTKIVSNAHNKHNGLDDLTLLLLAHADACCSEDYSVDEILTRLNAGFNHVISLCENTHVLVIDRVLHAMVHMKEEYEKLDHLGILPDRTILFKVYTEIGNIYHKQGRNIEALSLYRQAGDYLSTVCADEWPSERKNQLASLYLQMGDTLYDCNWLDLAMKVYNTAKRIWDELLLDNWLQDPEPLTMIITRIARTYDAMGKYQESLREYILAKEFMERMYTSNLISAEAMAILYTNIGNVLCELNSNEDPWDYYIRAINIYEGLLSKNQLFNTSSLASLYLNMGVHLGDQRSEDQKQHEQAIRMYKKARRIWEHLDSQGEESKTDNLAKVYYNLAVEMKIIGQYSESIILLDKCIGIWGKTFYFDKMSLVYKEKADVLAKLQRYEEAMDTYSRAQNYLLQEENYGRVVNGGDLMRIIVGKASVLQKTEQYEKSTEAFLQAATLWDGFTITEKKKNIVTMVNTCGAIGNGYLIQEEFLLAIEAFQVARDSLEMVKEEQPEYYKTKAEEIDMVIRSIKEQLPK